MSKSKKGPAFRGKFWTESGAVMEMDGPVEEEVLFAAYVLLANGARSPKNRATALDKARIAYVEAARKETDRERKRRAKAREVAEASS